jgi:hypothetical protein
VDLRRRLSIGLPGAVGFQDFAEIVDEFREYLHSLYFSPPIPVAAFHTRLALASLLTREGAEREALDCIEYARSRGLRLELALNAADNIAYAEAALDYAVYRGIEPDEVVAHEGFAKLVRERFPRAKLVYSYNNGVRTKEDLERIPAEFDDVVLGGACIRQRSFLARLRERGFGTRLLVNNGCSFNCRWCRESSYCAPTFERNIEVEGPARLYALQSLFPEELQAGYCEDEVGIVKLSSRPSDRDTLRGIIASYVEGAAGPWAEADRNNYRFWCRLSHFIPHFSGLDFGEVSAIKAEIWAGAAFAGSVS